MASTDAPGGLHALLGPIRQVAFVTRDMAASVRFYTERLGVGPWFSTERAQFAECRYRGEPCEMQLSAALASWGSVQLELIKQDDESPSMFRGWSERSTAREVHHHVAYWVEHYDGALAALQASGFSLEQDGVTPWGPFAYLLHADAPDQVVELTAATPQRRAFNAAIADAAVGWDGTRPYRSFADAVALADRAAHG